MNAERAERFAILWAEALPALSAFVRSVVPDFQQAEEILQRIAVTLVRKFDQYDAARSFGAWAIGFAKYEVLYYRRERATDKHLFDDELVERIAVGYQRFAVDADPYREALEHCLDRVDGRSRQAVELRYAHAMDYESVSRKLKLSPGATRMLLCRIRQKLRDCVEQRLGHAPT
jgi:RNA polymerase sigma-70 factor, ECF subfamily